VCIAELSRLFLGAGHADDAERIDEMEVELAIMVDYGEPVSKAINNIEGDRVLALSAYAICEGAFSAVADMVRDPKAYMARTRAVVARQLKDIEEAERDATEANLLRKASETGQPLLDYLGERFAGMDPVQFTHQRGMQVTRKANDFTFELMVFKSLRALDPEFVARRGDAILADIDKLLIIPAVTDDVVGNLRTEVGDYRRLAAETTLTEKYTLRDFWLRLRTRLPHFFKLMQLASLIQPSSAFMERVFSTKTRVIRDDQQNSLEDLVELTVMLCYHREHREGVKWPSSSVN
jgi:hypothetical protein